ncbi:E3 ubiquitin-protein ligase CHIP-like [Amphibalanus amphitrite]|uniref:E3 ubiquitin-protein ligase CHIP-like n=1 Tax=Amphibalanus amphitrite TaxID=1232801 RepID=UPI001C9252F1|nr:E3 ubiquitin-protein ligase CHIP-like [Amphibalanus amphitrite]XP_043218800.1 E3 ubiquitin-protein ligase CHIP-like [Amphibalanus amphitrite]XP_043218801.1 E3 ubiquitin-protein ligase CHIP-like [Amphibalanus amphitrite]
MERPKSAKKPMPGDESKMNAQQLKEMGNALFASRMFNDAVACYSKAIIKNPNVPHYFTNRALCYLKLQKWELACADCRRALDPSMDPSNVKGHFFLGQALFELNLYDESIKHLQRAHDLAREQMQYFGDDIAGQLRLVRKKRWSTQEERRITEEIELQSHLNRLLIEDKDRQVDTLLSQHAAAGDSADSEVESRVRQIEERCDERIAQLNQLFAKVDDNRRKRDVPDYLCGKISFEILRDPVITPSGITYDRKDIQEHLSRVGHFDPVTRAELTVDQLIPNLAMKEVVDTFVQENEWVHDF